MRTRPRSPPPPHPALVSHGLSPRPHAPQPRAERGHGGATAGLVGRPRGGGHERAGAARDLRPRRGLRGHLGSEVAVRRGHRGHPERPRAFGDPCPRRGLTPTAAARNAANDGADRADPAPELAPDAGGAARSCVCAEDRRQREAHARNSRPAGKRARKQSSAVAGERRTEPGNLDMNQTGPRVSRAPAAAVQPPSAQLSSGATSRKRPQRGRGSGAAERDPRGPGVPETGRFGVGKESCTRAPRPSPVGLGARAAPGFPWFTCMDSDTSPETTGFQTSPPTTPNKPLEAPLATHRRLEPPPSLSGVHPAGSPRGPGTRRRLPAPLDPRHTPAPPVHCRGWGKGGGLGANANPHLGLTPSGLGSPQRPRGSHSAAG